MGLNKLFYQFRNYQTVGSLMIKLDKHGRIDKKCTN